jgi:hypothetical protein
MPNPQTGKNSYAGLLGHANQTPKPVPPPKPDDGPLSLDEEDNGAIEPTTGDGPIIDPPDA